MQTNRMDQEMTVFFARELEQRKAKTYDIIKAPLRAFDLIPVSSEVSPGAEAIVYAQYDMTGIARIIANYADDLPRADVKGKEFTAKVKSVGNSYGYSIQEIRAAMYAGLPLEQRKANAAARAQRETWNQIAFFGDAEHGLPGWLTNANIPSAFVTVGAEGGTEWSTKTPDEILKDMNDLVNGIVDLTNGAEQPDTLVLPITQHSHIASTPRTSGTDTTILDFFLKNNPFIKNVEWANELSSTACTDLFSGEIMVAYKKDPDKFTLEMPQMFEQFPPQERGLEYIVPCHSRIAGVLSYYPLSQAIGIGI